MLFIVCCTNNSLVFYHCTNNILSPHIFNKCYLILSDFMFYCTLKTPWAWGQSVRLGVIFDVSVTLLPTFHQRTATPVTTESAVPHQK